MSYYIKGGSNYDTGAAAKAWLALHRAGFPSGHYSDLSWKDLSTSGALEDPFYLLGGDGQEKQVDIGLSGSYRIRVTDGGIYGWHVGSGVWLSLFGSGAFGTGVTEHGLLGGLGANDHPQYLLTGTWNTWTGSEYNILSGAVSDYPALSGDFSEVSGAFSGVSGDVVELMNYASISGDFADLSGDFSNLSGDYVNVSGDFVTVSGSYVLVSGSFVGTSGDYVIVSGDFVNVSGSFSNVSGDYVIVSGSYVGTSGDYVITSGDYVNFSGDFAALGSSFNTHITGLTGDSWSVVYTSGIHATGLDLGTSGYALMSNGTGVPPVWGSIPAISDIAYAASWDANSDGATKNTIYDKIEAINHDLFGFPNFHAGYTLQSNYSPVLNCAFLHASAYFNISFSAKKTGTYKIGVWLSTVGAPTNNKIRTTFYAFKGVDETTLAWNPINNNTTDFITGITHEGRLYLRLHPTTIDLTEGDFVTIYIAKTANDGTGTLYIRGVSLIFQ